MLPHHPYSPVVLMFCRADALLLGVLGAVALRDPRWREILGRSRGFLRGGLILLGAGFLYLTLRAPDPYGLAMLTFGFTLLASFYLCILLYGLTFREGWIGQCLRWGWLGWLGSIAYGTYLLHEFVRGAFFGLIWSRSPLVSSVRELLVSLLALAVTLVVCQLSWTYFEKPLIKRGHWKCYQFGDIHTSGEMTQALKGALSK
jgi:peptidoglycan/LPS O-acetylase OafA/YrhL